MSPRRARRLRCQDPLLGRDVEDGSDGVDHAVEVPEGDPGSTKVDVGEGLVGEVALLGWPRSE